MNGVIQDHDLLQERARLQNEGIPIEHSQMSLDKYLDRLSAAEQEGLLKLTDGLLRITTMYFRKDMYDYSLFGVGTTTYPDAHWEELGEYLKDEPSMKKYLNNKGEDIDLLFCPEHCNDNLMDDFRVRYAQRFNESGKAHWSHEKFYRGKTPSDKQIFLKRKEISNKMETQGFGKLSEDELFIWKECYDFKTMITGLAIENRWKPTAWKDGAPFGAHYWTVPEKHVEKEGKKIIRTKGENYGVDNMTMKIPGCRAFHIYVDDRMCAAHRIEYERQINIPFTIIYRAGDRQNLEDSIAKKNGTYTPRKEYVPPKNVDDHRGIGGGTDDFPF